MSAQLALGSHFARYARHFAGERIQLIHHHIDRVLQFENFALHVHGDFAGQISSRDRSRYFRDVSYLTGEVSGHRVDRVGQIFPRTGDSRHVGLTTETPFGSDFARHTGYFAGEPVELVHHRVESFFKLQDFAANVNGDFAR